MQSTSLNPTVANSFAGKNGGVVEMAVGADDPAFFAGSMWRSKKAQAALKKGVVGEAEVLLSKNWVVRITGVRVETIQGVERVMYETIRVAK